MAGFGCVCEICREETGVGFSSLRSSIAGSKGFCRGDRAFKVCLSGLFVGFQVGFKGEAVQVCGRGLGR